MRRIILIFVISVFVSVGTIYAQESDETPSLKGAPSLVISDLNGATFDLFTRLMSFPQADLDAGGYVMWCLLTWRIGLGVGYNYELKKGLFSPGAYLDFGINPLLLLFDSSDDESDGASGSNSTETDDADSFPDGVGFLCDIGIRINNQFSWNNIDIRPFYGVSFYFGRYLFHQVGLFCGIKNVGFEYAYLSNMFREKAVFHRVSVMLHIH